MLKDGETFAVNPAPHAAAPVGGKFTTQTIRYAVAAEPKAIETHIAAIRDLYSKLEEDQKAEILKWKTLAQELQAKLDKIKAHL